MLHSEMIENLQKHAPEAYQKIVLDPISVERRSAAYDSIHMLYASRFGDTLFVGLKRHQLLAKYLGTPAGWARLERLAGRLYARSWACVEAARLEGRSADGQAQRGQPGFPEPDLLRQPLGRPAPGCAE